MGEEISRESAEKLKKQTAATSVLKKRPSSSQDVR
jgi:hypothetical protein